MLHDDDSPSASPSEDLKYLWYTKKSMNTDVLPTDFQTSSHEGIVFRGALTARLEKGALTVRRRGAVEVLVKP